MALGADAFAGSNAIMLAVAIFMAMFSHSVEGGGMPMDLPFGWHPVLMTIAFPCLMVTGRWAYVADDAWGLDKLGRRSLHRLFMVLGTVSAIAGYVCIFRSHLPKHTFFGYDFENKEWHSPSRVLHSWIGYAAVILTLAQAIMGLMKIRSLQSGRRVFTFHGSLGKVIMVLGCLDVCLACRFWSWSFAVKIVLVTLSFIAMILGAVFPKASDLNAGIAGSPEHSDGEGSAEGGPGDSKSTV